MPIKSLKSAGTKALGQGLGGAEPTDPEFNKTVLLLHGDGSEGEGDTAKLGSPNYKAFKDNSTSAHAITVQGDAYGNDFSPYYYADGYWSNSFDGASDYLQIASSSDFVLGTNNFTIEFWVYFLDNATSSFYCIESNGALFYYDGTKFVLGKRGSSTTYLTYTVTPTLSTWHHVALCRDGTGTNETCLFYNGTRVAQATVSNNFSNQNVLQIGNISGLSGYDLHGYLSNYRVVNGSSVYSTSSSSITTPTAPFTDPSVAGELSVYFDGSGDTLTTSSSTDFALGTSDFTIEFWFYRSNPSTTNQITVQYGGSFGIYFAYSGTSFYATTANNTWNLFSNVNLNLQINAWNHVAFCRNGSTISIFANGTRIATATSSSAIYQANNTIIFGGDNSRGYISNFRTVIGSYIYDATQTSYTVPTAPLTAVTNTKLLTCQSKSFVDESSSSHGITANGNTRITQFSPFNDGYWSVDFDGSDHITADLSSSTTIGTGDFTVSLWVHYPSQGQYPVLFDTRVSGFNESAPTLYLDNSTLYYYTTGGTRITGTLSAGGGWRFVRLVRSSGTTKLFVDGSQTGSDYTDSNNYVTDVTWYIGRKSHAAQHNFTGKISQFHVSNTALTGTSVPTAPTTSDSNTLLLTCQSNRFIDNSSNGYTISLAGNPSIDEAIPFELLSRQTKLITCQDNRFKDIIPDRFPISINGTPKVSTNTPFTVTKTANVGSGFFDGTGDYLETTSSNFQFGTGAYTVEFWIYVFSNTGERGIFGTQDANNYGISFWRSGRTLYVEERRTSISYAINRIILTDANGGSIQYNEWIHYAVSRDSSSGTRRVFKNGVLIASDTGLKDIQGQTLQIGANASTGTTNTPDAYISNVRVTNTQLYSSAFTPPTTTLTSTGSETKLLTCQYSGAVRNVGFLDDSKYNHQITRNGDVSMGTFSPFSLEDGYWSVYFDGAGDELTFTNTVPVGTGDFTLELWVYPEARSNECLLDCRSSNGNSNGFLIKLNSNKFQLASTSGTFNGTTNIPLNEWTHLAIVREGTGTNQTTMYINGSVERSLTLSNNISSTFVGIGVFNDGSNSGPYNGYISNLRLVNDVVYSGAFTVSLTPLTAITDTDFLVCQSNRFVDNSTNGFAISIPQGTPKVLPFSPFAPTRSYSKDAVGGSVYYDGAGDYLTYTTDNLTPRLSTNWSIEFWMYLINHGSSGYLQQHGGSASNFNTTNGMSFQLYEVNNKMYYNPANGTGGYGNLSTSTRPTLNSWTHMVITNDGTQTSIFMNGVRVLNGTSGYEDMHNATTNNKIQLGYLSGSNYPTKAYFTGLQYHNTEVYDASSTTITVPTAPKSADANTLLLSNFSTAGIIDHTMKNNLETEGNTRISGQQVKLGTGSMYFDGTGDYCVIRGSELFDYGTGEFTIEMFIYPTALNANGGFIGSFNDPGSGWRFVLDSTGRLRFNNDSASFTTATGLITTNNWYHVVATRTSGTFKMFIDGTERNSTSSTHTINRHNSSSNITVGRNSLNINNWYFEGYIDELRVTKGVARYTSNFTPPTKAFANK